MMRVTWRSIAMLIVLAAWLAGPVAAADLKPIKAQKT